jgi:hypothetical protein
MSQSIKVAVIGLVACLSIAAAAKSAMPSTSFSGDWQADDRHACQGSVGE